MRLKDLFRKKDSSIEENQYKFTKDKIPNPPPKTPTQPIVADLMPLKNKADSLIFSMEHGNALLLPIVLLRCGCVGYFQFTIGMPTFRYIGMCPLCEIKEFIIGHRAIYKLSEYYN